MTMGTGLVGGAVGPLYGVGKEIAAGKFGTPAGTRLAEQEASRVGQAMTYQPRTQTGQALVSGAAKGFEALGGQAVMGLQPELTAITAGAAPAAGAAERAVTSGARAARRGLGTVLRTVVDPIGAAVTRRTVGLTQPEITRLANQAEKMGFRLEARQLQPDQPLGSPGFSLEAMEHNENLASRFATRATGEETTDITPAFLESRQKDLGQQLDQIYDRNFKIDKDAVDALRQICLLYTSPSPRDRG